MNRITALIKSFAKDEEGALVTEYGLLIVIVVLALTVALIAFRDRVGTWFDGIADELPTS